MHPGAILMIVALVIFRLVGPLMGGDVAAAVANFSPMAAAMVAGAIYLPGKMAFAVPFGALFVSTLLVNWAKGVPLTNWFVLGAVAGFAIQFALGWLARGTRRIPLVLGIMVAGSLVFYLLSNTMSFFFEPAYPRNFGGWIQCLTLGLPLPGAPPTFVFLVRSLFSDLLFISLFILACHPSASPQQLSRHPVQAA